MSSWTEQDLAAFDRASEIQVAGRRENGTPRKLVTIWHVVVDGAVYIRSVYGPDGQWYKGVIRHHEGIVSLGGTSHQVTYITDRSQDDAVDAAYFDKYGKGAPSQRITAAVAKTTTLRIEPTAV